MVTRLVEILQPDSEKRYSSSRLEFQLIGALRLVVNSIGAIVHVVGSVFMMLNGSMVPVSAFPDWLAVIARILPTTLGANVTRQILFSHQTLTGVWGDHSLQWAAFHAAIMYLGEVFFRDRWFPAPHEPLVDVEVFNNVQALLDERGEDHARRRSNPSDYLLGGLVVCAACGRHYL